MRIVLSGPPSIGKSTQAARLSAQLGVSHVSSGALIRDGARRGDPVAARLARIVADGSLAPTPDIVALVFERLSRHDCRDGFVLDGFPRREPEAEALLSYTDIDAFCVFSASLGTLSRRLAERAKQASFIRPDDKEITLTKRIDLYVAETTLVRSVMRRAGVCVHDIEADDVEEEVYCRLRLALGSPALVEDDAALLV